MTIPSPGRDFVNLRDAACARADAREENQCVVELEFKQQQVQSSAQVSSSLSLNLCTAHGDSGARIYERKKLVPAPIICLRVGGSFSQNPETTFLPPKDEGKLESRPTVTKLSLGCLILA